MRTIAFILGNLNRGGAETLILDVFRNAHWQDKQLLCVYRREGLMKADFLATGKPVICCPWEKGHTWMYVRQLRQLFKQHGVTHVHSQLHMDGMYAWLASIGLGIRVVNTYHGYDDLRNWKVRILSQLMMFVADDLCFVSHAQMSFYEAHYWLPKHKTHVLYNGIDFNQRLGNLEGEKLTSNQPWKLGMVGNFGNVRSHIVVAKAIQMLAQRGIKNFDFYFVGSRWEQEAELYDHCVAFCEQHNLNHVHFLGARKDVPSILKQLDGFVYSTALDTFGIAIVEAIAMEVPVVVNDHEVLKEVCRTLHGDSMVRFYKTNQADDCADKIEQLLADLSTNIEQVKKSCKEYACAVREQYSIDAHLAQLETIYK